MKNLELKIEGKEPIPLKIGDVPIQIKDFLDTDSYFELVGMTNSENQGKQMKDQGYFMMKKLIINPKISDAIIGSLPWNEFMKITKAMREEFMPEEAFLELGVQLDELSSE